MASNLPRSAFKLVNPNESIRLKVQNLAFSRDSIQLIRMFLQFMRFSRNLDPGKIQLTSLIG